ncbi:MAG TPA: RNA polymerase sigma factor [Steroidobacteraceae bacterium]|nr:RNA polymerase sigma factor [Steroidobacteraceae bacterium]
MAKDHPPSDADRTDSGTVPLPGPLAEELDPTAQSQRAFLTLLYSKYRAPLFRYVNGIVSSQEEAAEVVQETYLRVVRQSQVAAFETSARNYLFATATNLARDFIRRQRHRRHESLDETADIYPAAVETQPDHSLAWNQTLGALRSGINSLPPLTRDIFVMSRLRGMTHLEIAATLGIGVRTVERKMSEALERIASRLQGAS